mgnify:CR=1 FL=1
MDASRLLGRRWKGSTLSLPALPQATLGAPPVLHWSAVASTPCTHSSNCNTNSSGSVVVPTRMATASLKCEPAPWLVVAAAVAVNAMGSRNAGRTCGFMMLQKCLCTACSVRSRNLAVLVLCSCQPLSHSTSQHTPLVVLCNCYSNSTGHGARHQHAHVVGSNKY